MTCAPADVPEGREHHFNLVSWCCKRLPRVARSSEAAESQALAECQDEMDWCRLVWAELQGYPLDLKRPGEAIAKVPGALVTDATTLHDAVNARESAGLGVRDKRAAIEALRIRELLTENQTLLRWVNSVAMLGDGITKIKVAWMLVRFLRNNQLYRLVWDPSRHSARWRAANSVSKFEDIVTNRHAEKKSEEAVGLDQSSPVAADKPSDEPSDHGSAPERPRDEAQ